MSFDGTQVLNELADTARRFRVQIPKDTQQRQKALRDIAIIITQIEDAQALYCQHVGGIEPAREVKDNFNDRLISTGEVEEFAEHVQKAIDGFDSASLGAPDYVVTAMIGNLATVEARVRTYVLPVFG